VFLLAAALAALADGATAREARAATHELGRRLGPSRVRTPTLSERILAFYDAVVAYGEAHPGERQVVRDVWPSISSTVLSLLDQATRHTLRFQAVPVSSVHRDEPSFAMQAHRVPIPMEDITVVTAEGRRSRAPYNPRTRTPYDGLVQMLLDEWMRGENAPFPSASCFQMIDDIPSVLDWIDAVSPALDGRTGADVLAASRAWHAQFQSTGFDARTVSPGLVVLRWPDGWTLQRLLTKEDLAGEGTAMQHCVGGPDRGDGRRDGDSSYWREMRDGHIAILSLRDPEGRPKATVELALGGMPYERKVEQVQGPFDEQPGEVAMAHLVEAAMKLRWWPDVDSQKRLPRLGRIPVMTDAYLEHGNDASISAYTLRVLGDLARKDPDDFRFRLAQRASQVRTAIGEVLPKAFSFSFYWVHDITTPARNAEGLPETGDIFARCAARNGEHRILTVVWSLERGLRYVVQRGLTGIGTMFTDPYAALRAFTGVLGELPTERLAALEVLPGLPGQAGDAAGWATEMPLADARKLRAKQMETMRR
jgi:hypothetical protein